MRLRFVMDSTRAEVWPSTWAITALASASVFETRRCMRGDEGIFVFVERTLDYPVIFRNKRQALALAGDDKRQGGRLDAARRTHVAVTSKLHQGKVARKHRAPDEVDVLT